jgi:hypothetical protein
MKTMAGKTTKYVMTGKMKDGSTAPSGGVIKTKDGHAVKKTEKKGK